MSGVITITEYRIVSRDFEYKIADVDHQAIEIQYIDSDGIVNSAPIYGAEMVRAIGSALLKKADDMEKMEKDDE